MGKVIDKINLSKADKQAAKHTNIIVKFKEEILSMQTALAAESEKKNLLEKNIIALQAAKDATEEKVMD